MFGKVVAQILRDSDSLESGKVAYSFLSELFPEDEELKDTLNAIKEEGKSEKPKSL